MALAAGVSSISGSKRSVKIEAGMQISLSGMYVIGGGTNYACANVTWSEARVPGSSGPAVSYVKRLSDWTGRQEVLGRPRSCSVSRGQQQCVAPSDIQGLGH